MGQGVLMEPSLERSPAKSGADAGFISVVVPVVERADDLVALYRTFAAELESRGEEHEFIFVFDGGIHPSPRALRTEPGAGATSAFFASPAPSARPRHCDSASSGAGAT